MEKQEQIHLHINEYYGLNSGVDPAAKHDIAQQIKSGKIYVVKHEENLRQVSVDENDNFYLKSM
jgi:hypothetical protein